MNTLKFLRLRRVLLQRASFSVFLKDAKYEKHNFLWMWIMAHGYQVGPIWRLQYTPEYVSVILGPVLTMGYFGTLDGSRLTCEVNFHCLCSSELVHITENNGFTWQVCCHLASQKSKVSHYWCPLAQPPRVSNNHLWLKH